MCLSVNSYLVDKVKMALSFYSTILNEMEAILNECRECQGWRYWIVFKYLDWAFALFCDWEQNDFNKDEKCYNFV